MGSCWWLRGVAFTGFSHAMPMVCLSLDDAFAGLGGALEITVYSIWEQYVAFKLPVATWW